MQTKVSAFAWGLMFPTHMEWVNGKRLLVSAAGGAKIFDITEGGDFIDKTAFCSQLAVPGGIVQLPDGRILASDRLSDSVFDITSGDDATVKPFASGLTFPYGIIQHDGSIYVTEDNVNGGIESRLTDISNGGLVTEERVHAGGFPIGRYEYMGRDQQIMRNGSWGGSGHLGRILLSNGHLGTIFDVTQRGNYRELTERSDSRFAYGLGSPLGLHTNPKNGYLYVADTTRGNIYEIRQSGSDMSFAPAFATGFIEPSCIRWDQSGDIAYVCDKRAGAIFKIEVLSW